MPERRKPTDLPKVMDVTHPANVQPSTTSRPVIVTNRPMIPEDPMINQAAQSAIDIEKPAGAPKEEEAPDVTSAPEISAREGKTIVPITTDTEVETSKAEEKGKDAEAETPHTTITIDTGLEEDGGENEHLLAAEEPDKQTDALKEPVAPKATATKPVAEEASSKPEPANEDTSFTAIPEDGQLDEGDPESKEKTAEEKRQEELEEIIAAGTYRVPIGQVAKRRSRMVFTVIIIVLLLLALLDLALDMGLLTLSGVPHTNLLP
jgi:hypothetical protein